MELTKEIQPKFVSLHTEHIKGRMNGDQTERLSQEGECREEGKCSILDAASAFARGVLEAIEKLAGTMACKSVQLVRLRQWVQEQGRWFEDRSLSPRFSGEGV